MQTAYSMEMESPVGPMTLVADAQGLRVIGWGPNLMRLLKPFPSLVPGDDHPVLVQARAELQAYFRGERTTFSVPLNPVGTPFQQEVWRALQTIPFGQVWSYGQLAAAVGRPSAARAVGAANGRNPLSIVVPCHRVVGGNGALTGYAGGLEAKALLLGLEQTGCAQDDQVSSGRAAEIGL